MLVSAVMSNPVYTVPENASVSEVARIFRDLKIASVVVLNARGVPAGIVTERDLVERIICEGRPPSDTMAQDVMSAPLVSIRSTDTVENAAKKMAAKKIKNLTVFADAQLVGIVTASDLIRAEPKVVEELMATWVQPNW